MNKEEITTKELSDFLATIERSGGAMQYMIIQAETKIYLCTPVFDEYTQSGITNK